MAQSQLDFSNAPRVLVALGPDGNLYVELPQDNGVIRRVRLDEGHELSEIRSQLLVKKERNLARAEEARKAQAREENLRKERVRARTALDHGYPFAKKIFPDLTTRSNLKPETKKAALNDFDLLKGI